MNLKAIVIVVLTAFLLIPLGMIENKIHERENYRYHAADSIARSWTGEQRLYTPFLLQTWKSESVVQVYDKNSQNYVSQIKHGHHRRFLPLSEVKLNLEVETERRQKGIYSFPVYTAKVQLQGHLKKTEWQALRDSIQNKADFSQFTGASIVIAVSDPRGFMGVPSMALNGETKKMLSGTGIQDLHQGLRVTLPDKVEALKLHSQFSLRGMRAMQIVPVALEVDVAMQSPWAHPAFVGSSLPVERNVSSDGFTALWQLTEFSSGVVGKLDDCERKNCASLIDMSFGVTFLDGVDIYLQATRAAKYGILFIVLSFVTFFLYETLKKLRIHPVQYTLVGLAITIFYLLLVSLSEHIPYALAYILATIACVTLLSYYLRFVLGAWKDAGLFALLYTTLYGLLYVIIRSEDTAMLMGTLLLFLVLAGVMVLTRNIDWYEVGPDKLKSDRSLSDWLPGRKSEPQ